MSMHSGMKLVAATCLSFLLVGASAPSLSAQAIHEGKVTGTVAGEDQAVMPGVTLEIVGPAMMGP